MLTFILVIGIGWLVFNSDKLVEIFQHSVKEVQQVPRQSLQTAKKNKANKSRLARRLNTEQCISATEELEDEEAFDTELHTPLSMIVDEGEAYSVSLEPSKISATRQRKRVQRTPLQKAYIYKEIFSKCKGWDS